MVCAFCSSRLVPWSAIRCRCTNAVLTERKRATSFVRVCPGATGGNIQPCGKFKRLSSLLCMNLMRDSISTCCATENGASTSSAGFFGTLIAGLLSSGAMGLTKARLARVRCRKSPQESSTTPGCDP